MHPLITTISLWDSLLHAKPVELTVFALLLAASLFSWTIVFSKWGQFRTARDANQQFLRAFRKAQTFENAAMICEQFRHSPLVRVFDFGYSELGRQVRARGGISNQAALERSLQIGIGEEIGRLDRNLNWLATVATVSPFIGLFGTVWGIMDAFQGLGQAGSASLRAVAPGISGALIATAMGLAAAIPAAIFYNYFGNMMKDFSGRMEDFSLEFLNFAERFFEGQQ